MDQRRMDAEGGRVVHRSRRAAGKLAVVVAVQNLLVVACMLATYYVYQDFQSLPSEDTAHIQFDAVTVLTGNKTVTFNDIRSFYKFEMNEEKDLISIECTGPYIWHMEVCYEDPGPADPGQLQLQVKGSKAPVSSIELAATHLVCRGLHSIAYLRAKEKVSLHLYSKDKFLIRNITMGLSYLLGKKCDY